jgi:hypothetical protein
VADVRPNFPVPIITAAAFGVSRSCGTGGGDRGGPWGQSIFPSPPAYPKNEIVSHFEGRLRLDIAWMNNGGRLYAISLSLKTLCREAHTMSEKPPSKSAHLQELIHRRDKVLAVLHPPTAAHARIMEKAGCEALFVGTGGVVGAYTGLSDVGTATMTECVTIAGLDC